MTRGARCAAPASRWLVGLAALFAHCTYPFDEALLHDSGGAPLDAPAADGPDTGPRCGCVDAVGDCHEGSSDRWLCGTTGGTCARCDLPFEECRAGACAVSSPVVDLDGSDVHSCAIDSAGVVYCSGTGLGVLPQRTDGPYVAIGAARLDHSCAVRANGTMSCWGRDSEGELGDGPADGTPGPVEVSPGAGRWVRVASGNVFNCAVLELGEELQLHCWGYGSSYRLGLGLGMVATMPAPVRVGSRADWREVEAGETFACATAGPIDDPELHCWGANDYGQTGRAVSAGDTTASPMFVIGSIRRFALGTQHACAITTGDRLLCWGRGDDGRLGLGDVASTPTPTLVAPLTDVRSVATGDRHTCAIAAGSIGSEQALYCWGDGEHGQGGAGVTADRPAPMRVGTDGDWAEVWAGFEHGCATKLDGRLYCWGRNDHGEMSLGARPLSLGTYPTPTETTP